MHTNSNILYISGNIDHLIIIQSMLKYAGYECDLQSNATAGLEAALNNNYRLILVDVIVPAIDGVHVVELLKKNQADKSYRLVAITVATSDFSNHNPYEMGFDAHLSKPVTPIDLSHLVKKMLQASVE